MDTMLGRRELIAMALSGAVLATAGCAGVSSSSGATGSSGSAAGGPGPSRSGRSSSPTGSAVDGSTLLVARDVAMAQPATSQSYTDLAAGMRSLGYEMARHVPHPSGNSVFAPTSLAMPFAQLREGASGRSAEQIDAVLRLPRDRQAAFNGLLHLLATSAAVKDAPTVQVDNALFADPSIPVRSGYLATVKKWYDAGVHEVAFPDPALAAVNRWAKTNTHGRIPKLFSAFLPGTKFAIVNTTYLAAQWATPFSPTDTKSAPFSSSSGSSVSVRMMNRAGLIDYASAPGWQAVRLPYRGGQYSMWVLLPGGHSDPGALLAPDVLAKAAASFRGRQLSLSLPRWNLRMSEDLATVLRALGMSAPFAPNRDFTSFTTAGQVRIGQVVQQATIEVTEKGTVAAAASGIGVRIGAVRQPPSMAFVANHAFAYVITQNSTGVPLFEGTVGNPDAR